MAFGAQLTHCGRLEDSRLYDGVRSRRIRLFFSTT